MVDIDRDGVVAQPDLDYVAMIMEIIDNGGWSWLFYVADVNHDGQINILDLSAIGGKFGQHVTACHWADADGNGRVTKRDLKIMSDNFGKITQYSNRYDINNDGYVNILDVVIAQKELGKFCN